MQLYIGDPELGVEIVPAVTDDLGQAQSLVAGTTGPLTVLIDSSKSSSHEVHGPMKAQWLQRCVVLGTRS